MMKFNGIDFSQARELRQVAEGRRVIREIREEMNRAVVMSLAELDRKMMDEARRSLEERCRDMARTAAAEAIIGDLASELTPEDFARVRESKRTPPASAAPAPLPGAAPAAPSASPAARPEAAATAAAPEATDSASAPAAGLPEDAPERNARRLREFEELGGEVRVSGGVATLVGRRGALQELADRERAAGRPRSDRSDISKALKAEALRRHASQHG